jgi:undecaprenyl pyrophosphate phosphatase UppP
VISYGIIYFWLEVKMVTGVPWYLAYPVYYLAGLVSSYLVCKKAESDSLLIGVKSAIISWVITVIGLLAITQQTSIIFFVTLLVLMILGGVTSADIVKKRNTPEDEPEG